MPIKIITIYLFFNELLKAARHQDDPQARLSTAAFFVGNQDLALTFLTDHGY